jgi:hypothetical protein
MAKAFCRRMCWTGSRLYYPRLKQKGTDQEIPYDVNPADPWAIHFEFPDPDAARIQKSNELMQQKRNLETDLKRINRSLAEEKIEKEAELARINQALHDIPNAFKVAAGAPPTIKGVQP